MVYRSLLQIISEKFRDLTESEVIRYEEVNYQSAAGIAESTCHWSCRLHGQGLVQTLPWHDQLRARAWVG